jgi:peptidoglycan/LPS O-acetylase OafA/YrhL
MPFEELPPWSSYSTICIRAILSCIERPLRDHCGSFIWSYLEHYFAGSAVMVFFALSGYLVGGSALRAMGKNRWSWGNYLLN